jgi:hypothetical protein
MKVLCLSMSFCLIFWSAIGCSRNIFFGVNGLFLNEAVLDLVMIPSRLLVRLLCRIGLFTGVLKPLSSFYFGLLASSVGHE